MNNLKFQGHRRNSKTPSSVCTDVTNSVFTFYRRGFLLQRQHLSVKFTAETLIRRAIISPGIFKLLITFARIKNSTQKYITQISKTPIDETFRLTSVSQEHRLLKVSNTRQGKTSWTVKSYNNLN